MQLDPTVQSLLIRQVNAEQYAVSLYLAAYAWADAQAFDGLAQWARGESLDEQRHALKFLDYLNERGEGRIDAIDAPPVTFGGYADCLAALLQAEQAVSAALHELHAAADAAGDPATCLLATQQILGEQVGAEHRLTKAIQVVQRGAPVDLLDRELWEEAA